MARRGQSWGSVRRGAAVALVLVSLGFVVLRCATSPEIPFVAPREGVPWITAPLPVSAELQQWGRDDAPRVTFSRAFAASRGQGPVVLRLRALRRFRVELNGASLVEEGGGAGWRDETRVDLTDQLRPGRNEIQVEVQNLRGPALLWLRMDGLDAPVVADSSWWVSVEGRPPGAAVVADDTRINPAAFAVDTPLQALAARRDTALLLFVLGGLGFLAGRRLLGPRALTWLPRAALVVAALAWVALFLGKLLNLPLEVGFDARHHMEYVEFLRTEHRLPLATDGWSLYHPPLFYAASAAMAWLGSLVSADAPAPLFLKLVPFLCGLGNLWVALALARRLFPEDLRVPLLAVVFAAVLPMNIYGSAYFSNEAPHALLAGLALVSTVGLLRAPRAELRGAIALGAALGLAALTKFTALLMAPIALFFLACKLLLVERASLARSAGLLVACAATASCLAGWFYVRTWVELGQPVVGNWELPGAGLTWWQQPGFHTSAYYTGFGESLRHPYLAGFHSFWDGIYSTLWGDGGIAGRVFPADRHPLWNYGFMSVGFLAALPATALLLFGAARCGVLALGDGDPRLRAALSFVVVTSYAVGLSILYLTLELPFFAQAKAFYGLSMVAPLAVFFAAGAARCDQALAAPRWLPARVLLYAWMALFASVLFLSYAG